MTSETGSPTVNAKALATLFEFTYNIFHQNVAGFGHEDSLRQPPNGGNCLNWVGGHILSARNSVLRMLGHEPVWDDARIARYARGSDPILGGDDATRWEKILEDLDASQERLRAALAAVTPEELRAAPPDGVPGPKMESVGELLGAFHFHESYHVGQLGILRRVLGKPGAIA